MSFKDLEDEIQRWADLERFAQERQAEITRRKDFQRAKAKRGPVTIPERPARQWKQVTLMLSPVKPVPLSEWPGTAGEWAVQRIEKTYPVDAMSTTVAELEAIKLAKADGYLWHATLSVIATESKEI
ncbi:hypothetical protein [Pseudomonas sp. NPDC090208]|uniref:hypothetical protein n=1 Tax=Pseudomonas sp. NPDC090208 TaxID=3364478 RepID=UPI0037F3965B